MNNTLIIYDNANTKINNVLNKISEVIVDSKLHQVSDELKNIDNYSNIAVTIAMEDENNFKLYKSLRNYNIDFTNKKLIIICIGSTKQDVIKHITEVQEITKKSDLYYYFININDEKSENVMNAAINIKRYIEEPKKSIKRVIKELDKYKNNKNKKYINIKEFFEVFKNLKHITPNDPLGLNDAIRYFWQSEEDKEIYLSKHESFNNYYEECIYKFENILVYFIFRYA